MLKRSFFHTNLCAEIFVPLINCVIDDALLEMMPDIDQPLLQFIDVIFAVNRVQICAVGWQKVW